MPAAAERTMVNALPVFPPNWRILLLGLGPNLSGLLCRSDIHNETDRIPIRTSANIRTWTGDLDDMRQSLADKVFRSFIGDGFVSDSYAP